MALFRPVHDHNSSNNKHKQLSRLAIDHSAVQLERLDKTSRQFFLRLVFHESKDGVALPEAKLPTRRNVIPNYRFQVRKVFEPDDEAAKGPYVEAICRPLGIDYLLSKLR